MISKEGRRFLRWLRRQPDFLYFGEIQRRCPAPVEYLLVQSLADAGYLAVWVPPDAIPPESEYDIPEICYRVSEKGKAYLEQKRFDFWKWAVPTIISVVALLVSFIGLLR